MVCELMSTAAITPQQNAVRERHGGVWNTHAIRLIDEFSIKFVADQLHRVLWLTAAVTWACNSAIDNSEYSPAQWVHGRGLLLPYTLLDQTGRLSLHERVTRDRVFSERIAMMSGEERSITSLKYDRSSSVLARSRVQGSDPDRELFQATDVVYYWRGNDKAKREWTAHCHDPAAGIDLQHESLWLTPRTTTLKVQQRSCPTRPSIGAAATWPDARCASGTAGVAKEPQPVVPALDSASAARRCSARDSTVVSRRCLQRHHFKTFKVKRGVRDATCVKFEI